jgi:glycosyltransferase involved in cell wall biosynthesis
VAKKDSRVKVIHKEKNEKTGPCLKTGVSNAAAEYVMIIDSDDWIDSIMLEKMYRTTKNGNYDMVCCDYLNHYDPDGNCDYENGALTTQNPGNRSKQELLEGLILRNTNSLWPQWAKLVKTKMYENVDFTKLVNGSDSVIVFELFYFCETIGYVNKALYHYRHNLNSVSRSSKRNMENFIDSYISYVTTLLFSIENKIIIDNLFSSFINNITTGPQYEWCCFNNKIIYEYRKSLFKIKEMKEQNILTQERLEAELKQFETKAYELDKTWRPVFLFLKQMKNILPGSLQDKLRRLWFGLFGR